MNEITIDSISLTLNQEWELKENKGFIKSYYNKFGDKLNLNYFSKKPDLPEKIADIHSIRNLYRNMIAQAKGAIVEVEKEYINSLFTIKTVFKYSLQPSGHIYLGSYTIPRRNFSIVLKVQCQEHGITGMRESVILDKTIGDGLIDSKTMDGWFYDPYDSSFKAPLLSNIADKEKYDEDFPNHPLTRVRSSLKLIKENIEFSAEILKSSKFFLNFD